MCSKLLSNQFKLKYVAEENKNGDKYFLASPLQQLI